MSISPMHWRDKRCIACKGELPLPTWHGQPYLCCSGHDCGCGGGTLPIEFCSVSCWENYEPEPLEQIEDDERFGELVEQVRAERIAKGLNPDTGR